MSLLLARLHSTSRRLHHLLHRPPIRIGLRRIYPSEEQRAPSQSHKRHNVLFNLHRSPLLCSPASLLPPPPIDLLMTPLRHTKRLAFRVRRPPLPCRPPRSADRVSPTTSLRLKATKGSLNLCRPRLLTHDLSQSHASPAGPLRFVASRRPLRPRRPRRLAYRPSQLHASQAGPLRLVVSRRPLRPRRSRRLAYRLSQPHVSPATPLWLPATSKQRRPPLRSVASP